jgi:hypothetical protein
MTLGGRPRHEIPGQRRGAQAGVTLLKHLEKLPKQDR